MKSRRNNIRSPQDQRMSKLRNKVNDMAGRIRISSGNCGPVVRTLITEVCKMINGNRGERGEASVAHKNHSMTVIKEQQVLIVSENKIT